MNRTTSFVVAAALALSAPALAYDEDFDSSSGTGGGIFYDNPGGNFIAGFTPGYDDGLENEEAFAGSVDPGQVAVYVDLSAGVDGTAAGCLEIVSYNGPNPDSFLYAGAALNAGALASSDLSQVSVSVDVNAPLGVAFDVRVESDFTGTNNAIVFSGVGTGAYQTIGGPLSTGTEIGSFNNFDPDIQVIVAFVNKGQETVANEVICFDNVSLDTATGSGCLADVDGDGDADPDDIASFVTLFIGGCP